MDNYRNYFLIGLSFVAGFLGAQTADFVSAHGGDTTEIHGCVNPNSGEIKIIEATATCPSSHWKSLDWNIQGEPGSVGPQGQQGSAGSSAPASTVLCSVCYLENADLTDANLPGAFLEGSSINGTNLTNANLVGANLSITTFVDVNFTGADLTSADLTGSSLIGIVWSNTICPDGTNSDDNGETCIDHLSP